MEKDSLDRAQQFVGWGSILLLIYFLTRVYFYSDGGYVNFGVLLCSVVFGSLSSYIKYTKKKDNSLKQRKIMWTVLIILITLCVILIVQLKRAEDFVFKKLPSYGLEYPYY